MAQIDVFNIDNTIIDTIQTSKGITLQQMFGDFDWKNCILLCNGNNIDENYVIKENDKISIKQYPSGLVGTILLVTAVGVTTAVIVDKKRKEDAEELKKSLQAQNESLSNQIGQTEQLPTIRGASNQNANGKPIPFILGKTLFSPYVCGNGYSTIEGVDGENQYYNVMLMIGYSDINIKNIRMGFLNIASNGNGEIPSTNFVEIDGDYRFTQAGDNTTQIELRGSGEDCTLYPQKVAQENFSERIIHTAPAEGVKEYILKLDKFSALNPQKIEIEFSFDKLFKTGSDNKPAETSVALGIAISYDYGKTWTDFGQIAQSNSYAVEDMATYDSSISGTIGISTITRNKNKNLRFVAIKEFIYDDVFDADGKDKLTNRVALLRILRKTPETLDTSVQDVAYLSAIRTYVFDREESKKQKKLVPLKPVIDRIKNKTTRMAVRIKATDFIEGSLDKIDCIVEPKCKTWNGTEWSTTKSVTSNPASSLLNLLQHPMLGSNAYTEEKLNLLQWGELYDFCEEKGIKISGILTGQKKISDVINEVLSNCRSALILEGNKYGVWIDKPQDYPVTVLNNHNILDKGLSNRKSFDVLPDAYLVRFVDEQNEYQEGEFYVKVNEQADLTNPNTVIETISLKYITNYEQAYKYILYYHASRKLRPEVLVRKQGIEGNLVEIGNLVDIQDDTISVGIGDGGEITDVEIGNGHIVSITTDARFNITDLSKEYAVELNTTEGTRTDVVVFNSVAYANKFYFATPVSLDDMVQYHVGDKISFGILGKVTAQALVLGKKQNSDQTFDLTLVPYQEGIYTADEGVIPEYNPKTTGIANIVQTPVIPKDFNKIPVGKDGKDGKDGVGLTVFLEKSALVYDADNLGVVTEQTINDKVRIEQSGIPVPFTIGQIIPPSGFEVTSLGTIVTVKALAGNKMAKNGVIRIPINYSPVVAGYNYIDENGNYYTDENGDIYTYVESTPEIKKFDLYISYAKAEKGKRAPEYVGILTENPTGIFQEGDYYINKNDARIYRYEKAKPVQFRMLRASPRLRTTPKLKINSLGWAIVDSDTEPSLYYEKINELTSVMGGLPEDDKTVKFVNGYFDLLFANTGYIRKLFSERITLSQNGLIQSENYKQDESGTLIKANGETEINNLKARGDISAKNIFIENMGIRINAGDFFVGRYNATLQFFQQIYSGATVFYFTSKWGNNFYSPASGSFRIEIGLDNKINIKTVTYDLFKKDKNGDTVLIDTIDITQDTPIGKIKEEILNINYGDTIIWEFRNWNSIDSSLPNTISNLYIDFYIENENYTIKALCGGFSYNIQEIYPTK